MDSIEDAVINVMDSLKRKRPETITNPFNDFEVRFRCCGFVHLKAQVLQERKGCDMLDAFVRHFLIVGDLESNKVGAGNFEELELLVAKVTISVIDFQISEMTTFLQQERVPPLVINEVGAVNAKSFKNDR